CCRLDSLKTLLMSGEGPSRPRRRQRLGLARAGGRFSGLHQWPVLGVNRGVWRALVRDRRWTDRVRDVGRVRDLGGAHRARVSCAGDAAGGGWARDVAVQPIVSRVPVAVSREAKRIVSAG